MDLVELLLHLNLFYNMVRHNMVLDIHHNLFITLLLGSRPISVLAITKPCFIESKMYTYIGKSILNHYLGSNTKPCYIQYRVIMSHVIKRLRCNKDQRWIPNDHFGLIFLFNYTFYSHYKL